VIRTAGDPTALGPALRRIVAAADPDLPIANVRSMQHHLGMTLLPARVASATLGIFGVLGLILASIGVYGVMSHTIAQRRREIGIRVAIGAAGSAVLLREGMGW
jgi:hypothetical protein